MPNRTTIWGHQCGPAMTPSERCVRSPATQRAADAGGTQHGALHAVQPHALVGRGDTTRPERAASVQVAVSAGLQQRVGGRRLGVPHRLQLVARIVRLVRILPRRPRHLPAAAHGSAGHHCSGSHSRVIAASNTRT